MRSPLSQTTIEQAHSRISPYIHRTPVITSKTLNDQSGMTLFFKCENLQKVGAFKARGAMNAVLSLTPEESNKGVATHSSGNHGQALAWAARQQGIPAYIVMPKNSPKVKVDAVRGYSADVTLCEPTLQAREDTLNRVIQKTGAHFVHPYNDYRVMAGQATCAKELIEDMPELDLIFAPVGGGGLLSGTAMSANLLSDLVKVIGCEPEMADDAYQSFQAGRLIPSVNPDTIADGLKTSLGDKTFPVIHQMVDQIVTVSEAEITSTMQLVWERLKLVIEPSAAVSLAGLLKHSDRFKGLKAGVIFTGGNVDLAKVGTWFASTDTP